MRRDRCRSERTETSTLEHFLELNTFCELTKNNRENDNIASYSSYEDIVSSESFLANTVTGYTVDDVFMIPDVTLKKSNFLTQVTFKFYQPNCFR